MSLESIPPPQIGPPAPRSKAWLPCGCMLLALLSLILAPVLAFVAWNQGNARDVARLVAKAREAGQPMSGAELDQFYKLPDGTNDTSELWLDGCRPLLSPEFQESAKDIPVVGNSDTIPRPGEPWPDMSRAEAFLEQHSDSLELFHQAAAQGGAARFPVDFTQGFNTRLDHAQNMRTAVRLLKLEAYVRGHHGDAAGCAASIKAMFAARRSMEQEPILVCNLICFALQGVATDTLADTMTTVPLTDQALQSFQQELRAIDQRGLLRRGLYGERAIGIDIFHNPHQVQEFAGSPVPLPMLNSDLSLYLELFDEYLVAIDKDFPECRQAGMVVEQRIKKTAGEPLGKLGHIYSMLMMPAIGSSFDAAGRSTASGKSADAAIGVVLFYRKNQRMPKGLDELVPEFITAIANDPFDGRPLRYEVRNDGFVIYSIGRDGKDDGGNTEAHTDDVLFVPTPKSTP